MNRTPHLTVARPQTQPVRPAEPSRPAQPSRPAHPSRPAERQRRPLLSSFRPRRTHFELPQRRWARLKLFDEALLHRVISRRSPVITFLLSMLCRLADPDIVIMAVVAIALGGQAALAENLTVALIASALITQTVKRTVKRSRPHGDVQALVPPDRYSFPSGHTAAAFALVMTLTGLAPALVPIAICVACIIGYARMYLGVHYPVDVACGAVIGMFTGSLVALLPPVSTLMVSWVEPIQAAILGLS